MGPPETNDFSVYRSTVEWILAKVKQHPDINFGAISVTSDSFTLLRFPPDNSYRFEREPCIEVCLSRPDEIRVYTLQHEFSRMFWAQTESERCWSYFMELKLEPDLERHCGCSVCPTCRKMGLDYGGFRPIIPTEQLTADAALLKIEDWSRVHQLYAEDLALLENKINHHEEQLGTVDKDRYGQYLRVTRFHHEKNHTIRFYQSLSIQIKKDQVEIRILSDFASVEDLTFTNADAAWQRFLNLSKNDEAACLCFFCHHCYDMKCGPPSSNNRHYKPEVGDDPMEYWTQLAADRLEIAEEQQQDAQKMVENWLVDSKGEGDVEFEVEGSSKSQTSGTATESTGLADSNTCRRLEGSSSQGRSQTRSDDKSELESDAATESTGPADSNNCRRLEARRSDVFDDVLEYFDANCRVLPVQSSWLGTLQKGNAVTREIFGIFWIELERRLKTTTRLRLNPRLAVSVGKALYVSLVYKCVPYRLDKSILNLAVYTGEERHSLNSWDRYKWYERAPPIYPESDAASIIPASFSEFQMIGPETQMTINQMYPIICCQDITDESDYHNYRRVAIDYHEYGRYPELSLLYEGIEDSKIALVSCYNKNKLMKRVDKLRKQDS